MPLRPLTGPTLVAALLLTAAVGSPRPAAGQEALGLPRQNHLQVGLGALPGIGLQVGYLSMRGFFTAETALYVDGSPQFAGGEGSVQVAAGLGGAIRIATIVRTIGNTGEEGRELDVGLRFGPGLFFATEETRADKNRRFNLFLEPFFRFSSTVGAGRTFYVEIGIQRPIARAGFWFGL